MIFSTVRQGSHSIEKQGKGQEFVTAFFLVLKCLEYDPKKCGQNNF